VEAVQAGQVLEQMELLVQTHQPLQLLLLVVDMVEEVEQAELVALVVVVDGLMGQEEQLHLDKVIMVALDLIPMYILVVVVVELDKLAEIILEHTHLLLVEKVVMVRLLQSLALL
jgi:hypothetical protein